MIYTKEYLTLYNIFVKSGERYRNACVSVRVRAIDVSYLTYILE